MTLRPRMLAIVLAITLCPAAAQAQPYAERNGWWFDNFPDATLPWDIYRESYIGIPPTRDPASSAFDVLFYDQVYKTELAKEGNCFGMSLLSLMILKKGGHFGYCQPIPQYSGDAFGDDGPTDPGLKRAINIMHGHQVNLPTLQHILEVIGKSKNRDGAYAFSSFQFYKLKNDPTLVSITKSLSPSDGGHTLVAYDAVDMGGGNRRIYVYDPNRTWADPADRAWYTAGSNFITISGTSWSFDLGGSLGVWSGSPASGGNLLIIPISIAGPHSRSPASMGDGIIGQILTTIFISGSDAHIEQVTDAQGRRLFKPGTVDIDTDPATGMLTMLPWYPSDQGRARQATPLFFFHLGGSASTLSIMVKAGEQGYRLRALGPRGMVTVAARGGQGSEQVTLRHAGTLEPQLVLTNERGTLDYDVHFAHVVQPGERLHVLRARNLRAREGAIVELAAVERSRALFLAAPTGDIEYDLELRAMTRKGEEILSRPGAGQSATDKRIVRPSSWYDLKGRDVIYRRPADRSVRP
jgi:hypothetical protein